MADVGLENYFYGVVRRGNRQEGVNARSSRDLASTEFVVRLPMEILWECGKKVIPESSVAGSGNSPVEHHRDVPGGWRAQDGPGVLDSGGTPGAVDIDDDWSGGGGVGVDPCEEGERLVGYVLPTPLSTLRLGLSLDGCMVPQWSTTSWDCPGFASPGWVIACGGGRCDPLVLLDEVPCVGVRAAERFMGMGWSRCRGIRAIWLHIGTGVGAVLMVLGSAVETDSETRAFPLRLSMSPGLRSCAISRT
jgi:hypothetical protein